MGMSDSQNQPPPSSHFLLPAVGRPHSFLLLYIGLVQKTENVANTASKHCHMETLPGELTLSGPKSKIPEDDLTGQVRTVDSQSGWEGSSTEEQGRALLGERGLVPSGSHNWCSWWKSD